MAISRTLGGGLRGLRERIAGMTTPAFRTNIAQLCGAAALKLVADEFNGSHDPYDTPWAELASRRGPSLGRGGRGRSRRRVQGPRRRAKPLLDTGRLRASFTVQPGDGFFRIGSSVGYARFHQFGTRRMVARPMLPGQVIPEKWTDAFAEVINRAVTRQLQRGAA